MEPARPFSKLATGLCANLLLSGGDGWRRVHGGERCADSKRKSAQCRDCGRGVGSAQPCDTVQDSSSSSRTAAASHRSGDSNVPSLKNVAWWRSD